MGDPLRAHGACQIVFCVGGGGDRTGLFGIGRGNGRLVLSVGVGSGVSSLASLASALASAMVLAR